MELLPFIDAIQLTFFDRAAVHDAFLPRIPGSACEIQQPRGGLAAPPRRACGARMAATPLSSFRERPACV
jgi:hypothetical protein